MLDLQQEQRLATYLRTCGHFLYYQTGGKAGQRRILVTLLKREGLTQRELQETLEISSGALSEILQKMEDASLIERKKSCDDKRQVMLTLTATGKEMALEVREHYYDTLKRMFECLSEDDKANLEGLLAPLVEHLNSLKADPMFSTSECGC